MDRFKKIKFWAGSVVYEVPIKTEFHQQICNHIFKKGKIIKSNHIICKSKLSKDIKLCINCGKKYERGKKNERNKCD